MEDDETDAKHRLADIARHLSLRGQVTDAGELLADAARRAIGESLASRTARRIEPALTPRARPRRAADATPLRPALR